LPITARGDAERRFERGGKSGWPLYSRRRPPIRPRRQVAAGMLERPVVGRAGGEDDRVVEVRSSAIETSRPTRTLPTKRTLSTARPSRSAGHRLDRLVVGRDAEADQP
jgi:hypothetical protein